MTEIRNIYGKVIATGEGTVAEVAATNRARLREADLSGADLREAKINAKTKWPAPTIVLLAYWGVVSDPLRLDLMRWDAFCHEHPESFMAWGKGGPCPYQGVNYERAAHFPENRELIGPDFLALPVCSPIDLMTRLLRECCTWEE